MTSTLTPQQPSLVVFEGDAATYTSQFPILAVVGGQPIAPTSVTSQLPALAVVETEGVSLTSQLAALMVYGVGADGRFNQRAWTFDFDGHSFYILHLGLVGTYIFDMTTGQWSQWQTEGYETWNMENGWTWDGDRVIAGDNSSPIVWEYQPNSRLDDDFREMRRKVTGSFPLRGRDTLTILGLHLTASVGDVSVGARIRMRFSDNQAKTWSPWYVVEMLPGAVDQVLNFRSLGTAKAPGRVFDIEDEGGPVRIDTAELDIYQDPEEDG